MLRNDKERFFLLFGIASIVVGKMNYTCHIIASKSSPGTLTWMNPR